MMTNCLLFLILLCEVVTARVAMKIVYARARAEPEKAPPVVRKKRVRKKGFHEKWEEARSVDA